MTKTKTFTGILIIILVVLPLFFVLRKNSQAYHVAPDTVTPSPAADNITPLVSAADTPVPVPTDAPINFPITQTSLIYLYPAKTIPVSVKLKFTGTLLQSEPKYPGNDWYVISNPQSLIENSHDYLSYAVALSDYETGKNGWVVKTADLDSWFDKNLPLLGLNQKETSQFEEYWEPQMSGSGYYEIKLLTDSFQDKNLDLVVNPNVDNVIRVELYFKHLTSPAALPPPKIDTPARGGFTAVEVGAALEK